MRKTNKLHTVTDYFISIKLFPAGIEQITVHHYQVTSVPQRTVILMHLWVSSR